MNDPRPVDDSAAAEAWTVRVQDLGQRFKFPPTPPIAGDVRSHLERRRWPVLARAGAVLLVILLVIVLAVPDLRARAFDFLGLGSVRIVRDNPTSPASSEFDPAYKTTLEDTQAKVTFPIRLPTYPPDLGAPDAVYLYPGDIVILAWSEPTPLSLHLIDKSTIALKHYSEQEVTTRVNGRPALWLVEPHIFQTTDVNLEPIERLVKVNVLVWQEGLITYRLETKLEMDVAVQIAESVQ